MNSHRLLPIFMAVVVLASSAIIMSEEEEEEEANDALFQWPSFTKHHHHHHDSTALIKRFQCGASVHNVYACLRESFINIHGLKINGVTHCCVTIRDFHDKCSDFRIGKLESFLFPAILFKQCSAGNGVDPPAPASAPAAAGPAADIEV